MIFYHEIHERHESMNLLPVHFKHSLGDKVKVIAIEINGVIYENEFKVLSLGSERTKQE